MVIPLEKSVQPVREICCVGEADEEQQRERIVPILQIYNVRKERKRADDHLRYLAVARRDRLPEQKCDGDKKLREEFFPRPQTEIFPAPCAEKIIPGNPIAPKASVKRSSGSSGAISAAFVEIS